MTDYQQFASTISGAIQAAKSAAAAPDLSQPEYFRTILRGHVQNLPDQWGSQTKQFFLQHGNPSLESVAAVLNEDIFASVKDPSRSAIYQLLLRFAIVVYGIESDMLRSLGSSGGPLF